MYGSGRMLQRFAKTYRHDDLRRAAEWRREAPRSATMESARPGADRPRAILRATARTLELAIGRLRTRST